MPKRTWPKRNEILQLDLTSCNLRSIASTLQVVVVVVVVVVDIEHS